MQIVRDLGGYTLGRSDLVRRAMSKKKQSVMEKERANFIFGNKEEDVPGCIENGISEQVAGEIYDDMMDFAKYAFNKSHAAAYAVVSYETAWLKYYYPVEFMAALLTSVIDNSGKVAEYILTCRNMGIKILPPDVNEGEKNFSVKDGAICFALTAIKGVGRPVIEALVKERRERGRFTDLNDFITRMSDAQLNKRVLESFIKAGALDCFEGTRKQQMAVYNQVYDRIVRDKKNTMAGQITLFDLADEEEKAVFTVKLPDIGEYEKEVMLAFEKEVIGVYVSGHPLEEYEDFWRKHITATTGEFLMEEETGIVKIQDGRQVTVGGIITEKKVKYTKEDKAMAFITLEDLIGSIEVIVFPNSYEKNARLLVEDKKVFITGRVSLEEDRDGKLICQKIEGFDEIGRKLWIKFPDKEVFVEKQDKLEELLAESEGKDTVIIYVEKEKSKKQLPKNQNVNADTELILRLKENFGEENVVLV